MSKNIDRAAEMNRLIVEQGHATRSIAAGWEPTDEEQAVIRERGARLVELVELLGAHLNAPGMGHDPITAEHYVNERIAAWLRMNPLGLTNQHLVEKVEPTRNLPSGADNTCGVSIQIGEGDRAFYYAVMHSDLMVTTGRVTFQVPEDVAEHFRQQGRRKAQREMQHALGL